VPLVVRMPTGMWRSSAAQHSQSLEAWFAHIPGLVVVAPATPVDNRALLKASIRCDDPVVYLEHKNLWSLTGEVGDDPDRAGALGEALVVREGQDLTVVTWSASVHEVLKAAEIAAGEGLSVEVVDLRTLWPWDRDAVLSSVERTGRCLVVHEAVQVAGFGAEIAATVGEALFGRLRAPVRRLGAPRIPVSYAPPLEAEAKILAERDLVPAFRALVGVGLKR
jgi:acetoin:2,6-dichlorophenolindophenol oxidoreductase subunit beta